MLSVAESLRRVLEAAGPPHAEAIGLRSAVGRVLLEAVRCAEPFPAADNSAMDGFGVRAAELRAGVRLVLAGDSLAGRPQTTPLPAGACARVMTGGLLPPGADTVVPVERTSGFEPNDDGTIQFHEALEVGANIRRRGSVRAAGDLLVAAGTRLRPAHVGILAQQGFDTVRVARRPRVAVLPTGDEVVEIDRTPAQGQVRNSSAWSLAAQVQEAGGEPFLLPILRDRAGETERVIDEALAGFDLVCTIGGVSMGTRDLVRPAFDALGGETLVESIRVKPGKPTLFGRLDRGGRRSFLLGLPGNPASTFTIFALLGQPFVLAFQGASAFAQRGSGRLAGARIKLNWRTQALPGRLRIAADGVFVDEIEQRTSADLFCLGDADVLFLVPEQAEPQDGDPVDWMRLS